MCGKLSPSVLSGAIFRSVPLVCLVALIGPATSLAQQSTQAEFKPNRPELFQRLINTVPGMNILRLENISIPAVPCLTTTMTLEAELPSLPQTVAVRIPPQLSNRLAYYKAGIGSGALGPRGWACHAHLGSNGSRLILAPTGAAFQSDKQHDGPLIARSFALGETSGRYEVARVAAHLFPIIADFVEEVRNGGADIRSDPPPGDTYFHLSQTVAAFRTNPNEDGIAGKAPAGYSYNWPSLPNERRGRSS